MNNIPITISPPPAAAKPVQATPTLLSANPAPSISPAQPAKPAQAVNSVQNAKSTQVEMAAQAVKPAEDSSTQGKSFSDVLARQVSDTEAVEDTPQPKKTTAKTADDIFSNIKAKTDDAAASAIATSGNATANLPADMLATLVPQAATAQSSINPQVIQSALGASEGLSPKKTAFPPTGLPTASSADLPGTDKNISATNAGAVARNTPQIEAKKDAAFTNMMESMTAATAPKLFDHDDKAAALADSPQSNINAQAAIQAATAPVAAANVMPAQVTINTPIAHDNWGDEFNQKITWLSNQKEQTAELHLNPPQLGPMDVVLKVSGDQATALFTSPHAAVREAVEQALPRLREMMAENGIMLGNATVSDQAPRHRQDSNESKSAGSRPSIGGISGSSGSGNLTTRVSPITRHNGIVDTFA